MSWPTRRLRYDVITNPSKTEITALSPDTEVSFVPMEAVGEWGGLDLSASKPLSSITDGYTYVRNGDVVVAKITPCFENGKGAIAEALLNGVAFGTTELHVLRAKEGLDVRFLFYLTLSHRFRREGESVMYGAGGQKRVPDEFVRQFRHPIPPLEAQRAIAALLDRETARIDALVAKKERLLDLLDEKRTALITHAVTKGLDPAVPIKESGVECVGRVPAAWSVRKATWLFVIGSGTTPPDDPQYYGGDVAWVTTSELRESVVVATEKRVTDEAIRAFPSLRVHPPDSLAVAMYGATIGRLGILGAAAAVNQACCVFSDPRGIEMRFWFYWLQMRRPYLVSLGYGAGQPNLSQDFLRGIRVPVPPLPEQRAIIAFLDRETERLDALAAHVRAASALLREYRTALISAAVTGQIDVSDR